MRVLTYACPQCHGWVERDDFKAEGKRFTEIVCVPCARYWTPEQISGMLRSHENCCSPSEITRLKRGLKLLLGETYAKSSDNTGEGQAD